MPFLRYLERKMAGRKINTAKKSSLVDLLEAGLVIEEQVIVLINSTVNAKLHNCANRGRSETTT